MSTSRKQSITHRVRRARPHRASARYVALDTSGRWYEDALTGDLIEYLTPAESAMVQAYLLEYAAGAGYQWPYRPSVDWKALDHRAMVN